MDSTIQRLTDLIRRRIALEDEQNKIDEEISSLLTLKPAPVYRGKPPVKPKPKTAGKPGLHGKWSKKYDECQECHTTATPHKLNGLCTKCYSRWLSAQNAKAKKTPTKSDNIKWSRVRRQLEKEKPTEKNDTPPSSAAFTYQCDCGVEFKSVWDVDMGDPVHCPKCNVSMTRANKF